MGVPVESPKFRVKAGPCEESYDTLSKDGYPVSENLDLLGVFTVVRGGISADDGGQYSQ